MLERGLKSKLNEAWDDAPAILLLGARQSGKTTLARSLAPTPNNAVRGGAPPAYLSLDDLAVLGAAQNDPMGFVSSLPTPVIIDEVQRAPQIFPALKISIDQARRRALSGGPKVGTQFFLTGSANVLALPRLSESLAGRMETQRLYPLAQIEIEIALGGSNFVDDCFDDEAFARRLQREVAPGKRADLVRRIALGGFPEVVGKASDSRRTAWFSSYTTTILSRDVRDLSEIEGLRDLPRLLTILAARVGGLLNLADVSRASGLPYATLHRYVGLLEATFLVSLLPAWASDINRRLVKTPKLLLGDTGLATALLGLSAARLERDGTEFGNGGLLGGLLENFLALELQKLASWSQVSPTLFHFRTQSGLEVDTLLEARDGRIVGIESKASATVSSGDFKGLRGLQETSGARFERGILFYNGEKALPFGQGFWALPWSHLWS